MPRSKLPIALSPEELAQAVAILAQYLSQAGARFSISGGAASMLIRMQYGIPARSTEDIDLVVQPSNGMTADTISSYLLHNYPTAFVGKPVYGVITPALTFKRVDGSVKHVEIEIFDVLAWPQRRQYDLDDPDNDVIPVSVSEVNVPVFSPRWLLREKIVAAFERRGSRKEETDLDDATALLEIVEPNSLDLTKHEQAVRHIHKHRPDVRQLMEIKILCPNVLGEPWKWNEFAGVFWRLNADELRYLDADLKRHKFKWDQVMQVWYFTSQGQRWFYNNGELNQII